MRFRRADANQGRAAIRRLNQLPRQGQPVLPALLLAVLGSNTLGGQDLPAVPNGYTISVFADGLRTPLGLSLAPNGDLLVCTWDGGGIYRIDAHGAKTLLNFNM